MKYLVFSDTHLTQELDNRLFVMLEDAILAADKVIIAGDFWESYLTDFDRFLLSPWSKLFPLLLERNTVYLYGNSDKPEYCGDKWRAFAVEAMDEFDFTAAGYKFHVEHGHKYSKSLKGFLPRFMDRSKLVGMIINILEFIDGRILFGRLLGIMKNITRLRIRKRVQPRAGEVYVFGHSHYADSDIENGFIMLGNNRHGIASYLIVDDERNEIKLIKDLRY